MDIRHENILPNYTLRHFYRHNEDYTHWHQRSEWVYIVKGECSFLVGKEQKLCKPGDLITIHSGEIHALSPFADGDILVCTFNPQILYGVQPEIQFVKNFITWEELKNAGIHREVHQLFQEIEKEKDSRDISGGILVQSAILRLYGLLARHFPKKTPADGKNLDKFRQFQKALEYIADNYRENISLADIARILNYNTAYVSTLFVTYTGVNFKNYLDNFRIRQAVNMIKSTDLTISTIAGNCGFANIRTFNNTFQRIVGKTPSDLRKSNL